MPDAPVTIVTSDQDAGVIRSSGDSASGTTGSGGPAAVADRDGPAGTVAAVPATSSRQDALASSRPASSFPAAGAVGIGAGSASSPPEAARQSAAESAQPVRLRPSPAIVAEPGTILPTEVVQAMPAVFIHVYDAAGRRQMLQLEPRLRQHGMRLAGVKIVGTGPAQSDLRYFHASEKNEARQVQTALLAAGLPVHKLKSIAGYETRALPRQYEVWLSPGFQPER